MVTKILDAKARPDDAETTAKSRRGVIKEITESTITKALKDVKNNQGYYKDKDGKKGLKLVDGEGLYLFIHWTGKCSWRHKFSFQGREYLDTLGHYPETSIKEARRRHAANRSKLDDAINPMVEKRQSNEAKTDSSFETVAEDFIELRMVNAKPKCAPRTISKARAQLSRYINPMIGKKSIAEIEDTDLLKILDRIEKLGKIETCYSVKELLGRIFGYAKAKKLCPHNIVADIEPKALPKRPVNHLAAILERPKVGELLRAIEGYKGQPATRAALRILPHVFLRAAELRGGRWSEIDFKESVWRVPASRMKPVKGAREEHFVPLSRQSLAILQDLHEITGQGDYLFPAIGPKRRPISENTLNAALAALGYRSDQQTPHGFRAIFRTIAAEDLEIRIDWLELQLAHGVKDSNGKAYNRASFLPQRTKVMQQWSDCLDRLREPPRENNVVKFRKRASS